MSGERPAGEPGGETPAPDETAAPISPVRQGIRAALIIFAAAVAVELLGLAIVRMSGDPNEQVINVFFFVGLIVFVAGLWTAMTVSNRLPPAARGPFWAMGVLCAFLSMILWGVTCGLAGTPRFN